MNLMIVKMFSKRLGYLSASKRILKHYSKLKRVRSLFKRGSIRGFKFLGPYPQLKIGIAYCPMGLNSFTGTKRLQIIIRCIIIQFNSPSFRTIHLQVLINRQKVTIGSCLQTTMSAHCLRQLTIQLGPNIRLLFLQQFPQETLMRELPQMMEWLRYIQICLAKTLQTNSSKCHKW
jgi:hypothetical protein